MLPCAYFVVNKPYEHESRLALKALHAHLLTDADPEVRKRSKRLHAILSFQVERVLKGANNQASSEAPFTPPSLSLSASTTIIWPRKCKLPWSHFLKDKKDFCDLPSEVSCLCIYCWGATVVGPERCTIGIDPEPRWTNTDPAKYIERQLTCQHCGSQRRFVPIDEKIPSISVESLNKFYIPVRGFSQEVQLERLQEQRSSSRYHRWQKSTGKTNSKKKAGMPRAVTSKYVESRQDKGPVQTKCTLCHQKGSVNYHPQWLVGSDIYLARRTEKCMYTTCVGARRHWIPMDEGMDYITQKTFETYIKAGILSVKMHVRKRRQNLQPK